MASIAIDRTDGLSSATAYKGPCRVAAASNIVLSGLQTVDGVALAVGDRVLVVGQADSRENGIWVADTGPWRRSKDFYGNKDVRKGTRVWVTEGNSGPAEMEVTTENPISIGTSSIAFDLSAGSANAAALSTILRIVQDLANDIVSQGNVPIYATAAGVANLTIPELITAIRTNGYADPGDGGGALYNRVESEPSHAGKIQSDDGAWWELAEPVVSPKMLGAKGDGATDDSSPLEDSLEMGRPVHWGKTGDVYRVTRMISPVYTTDIDWRSEGAEILFDPASHTQTAIRLNQDNFNIDIVGKLTLDANNKANYGWYIQNHGEMRDLNLVDLAVRNVYRPDQTFAGGDGIYIRGSWTKVQLTRPDVRHVRMAAGAGIPTSQGVFGITIRGDIGQPVPTPGFYTIIDPYVEDVQCDDPAYLQDQDGIRILDISPLDTDNMPFVTSATVIGGAIKNCRNRSIKSQLAYTKVIGTQFIRDAGLLSSSFSAEIDCQNGGGIIDGCEFHYADGMVPRTCVEGSGNFYEAEAINGCGALVSNIRVNIEAGMLDSVVSMGSLRNSAFAMVSVKGVHVSGSQPGTNPGTVNCVLYIDADAAVTTDKEIFAFVSDIAAPVSSTGEGVVWIEGAVPTFVSGRNLVRNNPSTIGNPAQAVAFVATDSPSTLTKDLDGVNRRVSDS